MRKKIKNKKFEKRTIFFCLVIIGFFLFLNFSGSVIAFNILNFGVFYEGLLDIFIDPLDKIYIESPLNISYNFSKGVPFTLDLNVTTTYGLSDWLYTLEDLRHHTIIYSNVSFIPNSTFDAVRWNNKLTVYANDTNFIYNKSVEFYIHVNNSAPEIEFINPDILICEGNYLSYVFNATDIDEDIITEDISPKDPFFVSYYGLINLTSRTYEIFSGILYKEDVGGTGASSKTYSEAVTVSDAEFTDTKNTNITIIEINNAPLMSTIGVQTVWLVGDDTIFDKQVEVNDVEDGTHNDGNLSFNITFLEGNHLFNISSTGVMNFTPNASHLGSYNITVCVNDTGIPTPHQNISLCGQDGSSATTCETFVLSVTKVNRRPIITDYYPSNLGFSTPGTTGLYFNISYCFCLYFF